MSQCSRVRRWLRWGLMSLAGSVLLVTAGCGVKGDLYLPQDAPSAVTKNTSSTQSP